MCVGLGFYLIKKGMKFTAISLLPEGILQAELMQYEGVYQANSEAFKSYACFYDEYFRKVNTISERLNFDGQNLYLQ